MKTMNERLEEFRERGIIKVEIPNNGIEEAGMLEVANLVVGWLVNTKQRADVCLPSDFWFGTIGNDWLVTDKTKPTVGTFPKRVAKAVKRVLGVDMDSKIMGVIGDTARNYCPKITTHYVDFTQRFNWKAGDFGDIGSCFWGERSDAIDMMTDNGFWAMRFYDADSNGIGRCWLYPVNTGAILFNKYPTDTKLQATARVLAFMTGLYYQTVDHLSNKEDTCGELYINGGKGQFVGEQEHADSYLIFDFGIDEPDDDDDLVICEICGDSHPTNNSHDIENLGWVCPSCFEQKFTRCEDCDTVIRIDLSYEMAGRTVCESCADDYVTCDGCGDVFHADVIDCIACRNYCSGCYDKYIRICDCCGERCLEDDMISGMCDDCACDHTCHDCGEVSTFIRIGQDNKFRCDGCHKKYMESLALIPAHDEKLKPLPIHLGIVEDPIPYFDPLVNRPVPLKLEIQEVTNV